MKGSTPFSVHDTPIRTRESKCSLATVTLSFDPNSPNDVSQFPHHPDGINTTRRSSARYGRDLPLMEHKLYFGLKLRLLRPPFPFVFSPLQVSET
mmetsp:Transcript_13236/g.26888  ORF Transcript_13236/g.26888 Transcript_13236/m.26888 type:complete len:95 (+) Transcript_13236:382-666(+)